VLLDIEAGAVGHSPDRALPAPVLERCDPPATLANHVVMVLSASLRALIARPAPPDIDAVDQTERLQLVEGPVDARAGDCDLAGT